MRASSVATQIGFVRKSVDIEDLFSNYEFTSSSLYYLLFNASSSSSASFHSTSCVALKEN